MSSALEGDYVNLSHALAKGIEGRDCRLRHLVCRPFRAILVRHPSPAVDQLSLFEQPFNGAPWINGKYE